MTTQQLGNAAEQLALEYLIEQGLSLIEKNFCCKLGEIDIIMQDGNTLVFVEVRLRNNVLYGTGAETVTHSKMRKIIKTAQVYLLKHPLAENLGCRFDVISMNEKLTWIKNAFTLD